MARDKPPGTVLNVSQGRIHDPTQKAVRIPCTCEKCNGGWMKDLEDRVRPYAGPMMSGIALPLDAEQQATIAAWAVKTAMVWEHLDGGSAFYTDAERVRLRESLTIPEWTMIWLARYVGRNYVFQESAHLLTSKQASPSGFSATTLYGRLAIQILTVRVPPGETRIPVAQGRRGPWIDTLVQIWPVEHAVVDWPPCLTVGADLAFVDFAHRWQPNRVAADPLAYR